MGAIVIVPVCKLQSFGFFLVRGEGGGRGGYNQFNGGLIFNLPYSNSHKFILL